MFTPPFCPNTDCVNNISPEGKWYKRKGYYHPKTSETKIPRAQCYLCNLKFSEATFKDTYRQKKPHLNAEIYLWYTSSVSLRRLAKNLKTTRITATTKFRLLADKARAIHAVEVVQGNLNTDEVQFDEQESFVKTNNLPVSIAIAVDGRKIPRKKGGGKIIDIMVGTMPARGRNAKKSQAQYGFQKDERPYICRTVLNNVRVATMGGDITITTDAKPAYATYVRDMLPLAIHREFNRSAAMKDDRYNRKEDDPLWYINQACAANRHDISRMRRKTCVTTKLVHELQRHLWLYVAHRNGYERDLFDPFFAVTTLREAKAQFLRGDLARLAG